MPGRITFSPPTQSRHDRIGCHDRPVAENHEAGTIWTCDDCGKEWVVVWGAQYNEIYFAWRDRSKPIPEGESDV